MKVTTEQKKRLSQGDFHTLKALLLIELDAIKNDLLVFKPDRIEYDNILRGRGLLAQEIINLLSD